MTSHPSLYTVIHPKPAPPSSSWWATPDRDTFRQALRERLPAMEKADPADLIFDPSVVATAELKKRFAVERLAKMRPVTRRRRRRIRP